MLLALHGGLRRPPATLAVLTLVMLSLLSGCALPFSPEVGPTPLGVGRAADGRSQVFVPLCPGQEITGIEAHEGDATNVGKLLWRTSKPLPRVAKGGRITLGDAGEFTSVETPFPMSLPARVLVTAHLSDGADSGVFLEPAKIPANLAGTRQLIDELGKRTTDEEIVQQKHADDCPR